MGYIYLFENVFLSNNKMWIKMIPKASLAIKFAGKFQICINNTLIHKKSGHHQRLGRKEYGIVSL